MQEILLIQKKLTIFKAKSLHITRITLNYRTFTKLYEPQERSEVPPLVITFCISTCVRICFFGSNFSFSSIFFCVEKERTRRPFYSPRSKLVAYLTSFLQRYQHFWRSVFVNLSLFLSLSVEWNVFYNNINGIQLKTSKLVINVPMLSCWNFVIGNRRKSIGYTVLIQQIPWYFFPFCCPFSALFCYYSFHQMCEWRKRGEPNESEKEGERESKYLFGTRWRVIQ